MNCIHCNAPDAHPGTRKCTDLQACHGRQEYARGVKAALDELRDAVKLDRQRCGDDMAESLWKSELLILTHIDGEPARIAAACEEVREACARHIWAMSRRPTAEELMEMVGFARSTPLTATPLADEIAAMRARVAELEAAANTAGADASAAALRAMARATKAEAERDEAQRGEQEAWRQTDQMRAERDALRAQVEAARTYARQTLDYGEDCDATDLLAAMDEAKP